MTACRILIVEDEAIFALDLEGRLARMGYEPVGRSSSGEGAVALALELRPDLVLMDIRLSGDMDGIAAADEIRRSTHTPVIFLTAYSEDATLNRAMLADPFGYIFKPIDDRDLKSTIELALHKHRVDEEVRRLKCLYEMLVQVDHSVFRVQKPEELLSAICRAAVEKGGMDLAWIGYLDPITSRILPLARFGNQGEAIGQKEYYVDDNLLGHGSPNSAILDGQPLIFPPGVETFCPTSHSSPLPCRSCASFPIRFQGKVYYVLTLCTVQRSFFQEREVKLLKELALDIAYALDKMEGDLQREIYSEQYRSRSAFLDTLLDALPFPAFYKDSELRYLGCNAAFEHLIGVNRDLLIGRTALDLWAPDLASTYHNADLQLLADTSPQTYESAIERPDGIRRLVRFHKAVFVNADGTPGGIIGTVEDITERKAREQSLLDRLSSYQSLIDHATDGMAVIDAQSLRFLEFNDAAHQGLGYTREEFGRLTLFEVQTGTSPEQLRDSVETAIRTGVWRQAISLRHRDGRSRVVRISAGVFADAGQTRLAASWQDIADDRTEMMDIRLKS